MTDKDVTIKAKPNLNMYLNQNYDSFNRGSPSWHSPNEVFHGISELDYSENMAERIVRVLVRYISENHLLPGDQLPVEKKLGEILGIGNRPLREALIILRSIGLVTAKPGKGWFVGKVDLGNSLKFLSPLLQEFGGAKIKDIILLRLANEPLIARLAAENITESGLKRLEKTILNMKKYHPGESESMFREYDREFHISLANECGNVMLKMLNSILSGLFYGMVWWTPEGNQIATIELHGKIFNAVKAGDPEGAELAMKNHLENAIEWLTEHEILKA